VHQGVIGPCCSIDALNANFLPPTTTAEISPPTTMPIDTTAIYGSAWKVQNERVRLNNELPTPIRTNLGKRLTRRRLRHN
jgi:hypothetical protein